MALWCDLAHFCVATVLGTSAQLSFGVGRLDPRDFRSDRPATGDLFWRQLRDHVQRRGSLCLAFFNFDAKASGPGPRLKTSREAKDLLAPNRTKTRDLAHQDLASRMAKSKKSLSKSRKRSGGVGGLLYTHLCGTQGLERGFGP